MARDQKPKKANKSKYADPKTGAFRHPDGDRRHRGGPSAKKAIKNKKIIREFDGGVPVDDPPGDADA